MSAIFRSMLERDVDVDVDLDADVDVDADADVGRPLLPWPWL